MNKPNSFFFVFFAPLQSWQGAHEQVEGISGAASRLWNHICSLLRSPLSKGGASHSPPCWAKAAIVSSEKIHIQLRIDAVSTRQEFEGREKKFFLAKCFWQDSKSALRLQVVQMCFFFFQTRFKSISPPLRVFFFCFCGLLPTAALHWRPSAKQTKGDFSLVMKVSLFFCGCEACRTHKCK